MTTEIIADPIILAILAGALGGLIRSIFGWASGKDSGESFDPKKALASIIRATIGGAVIVFGITQADSSIVLSPLVAFFTALSTGATVDLLWHNTNTIIENRK
ncbi:MAG: hypothetical protein Q7R49_00275 [Candidatus Daviesbacteria bacterium]|nr:hypothetical protein [Candidatus Daviesbacteria bacterium]